MNMLTSRFLRPQFPVVGIALPAVLLLIAFPAPVQAQRVEGRIQIENPPRTLTSGNVLDLFKAFREGEHQIVFSFEGDPANFVLRSEVRHNGESLGTFEGPPMPYIPGDMFMCPEAFGFVGLLGHDGTPGDAFGRLAPGEYEVRLEAVPQRVDGYIQSASLGFIVPRRQ